MANTDFFDDDLVKQRESGRKLNLDSEAPLTTLNDVGSGDEVPVRPVSDFNLTRMAKHKQDVDENVVRAVEELERLRKRQEDLEREKRELEDNRNKQQEYEHGKREMLDRLNQSLVTLEKDELQAERLAELLSATRRQFKEMLGEIEAINEDVWPEENFGDELNRALAVVEDSRMEYNKALSKIEAAGGSEPRTGSVGQPVTLEESRHLREEEKPFTYWLKVGLAVTLPLIVVVLIVAAVFVFLQTSYLM